MESKAYKKLTGNAIRVLEMLSYKFYKNRWNETDFPVAQNFGVKVMGLSKNSGNTIKRALKKLVEYGFLERTYISPR